MKNSANSFRQTSIFNISRNKDKISKAVSVKDEDFTPDNLSKTLTSNDCSTFFEYFKKFQSLFRNCEGPVCSKSRKSPQEIAAQKAVKKAVDRLNSSKLPSVTILEANPDIGVNFSELKITSKKDGIFELTLYVKENRQAKTVAYKSLYFGTPDDIRKYLHNKDKLTTIYKEIQELSKLLKRNK